MADAMEASIFPENANLTRFGQVLAEKFLLGLQKLHWAITLKQ